MPGPDRVGATGDPHVPPAEVVLATERETGVDALAVDDRPFVDLLDRQELSLGHAIIATLVVGAARQLGGIELAAARIVQQPILDAVQLVARGEDLLLEQRAVGVGDDGRREARGVGVDLLLVLDEPGADARPVVRGRPGDDAVEIVGVTLRLHHALAASARAADEVRALGVLAIELLDDRLRGLRGQVHGAMAEVELALGIVQGPAGVGAAALVTGVGACGGVAALERGAAVHHRGLCEVLHAADEAAAAAHHEAAVPIVGEQQLEVDLLLDGAGDLAVRRLSAGLRHPRLARRLAGARFHSLSRGHLDVARTVRRVARTVVGARRRRNGEHGDQTEGRSGHGAQDDSLFAEVQVESCHRVSLTSRS